MRRQERASRGGPGWERDHTPGPAPGSAPGPDRLPVFLFPAELTFFAEERSTHRQVLTLYNPYSFPLNFKMLCTAPSLYAVVDAEGSVKPSSCVDIVVRHRDVSSHHLGRRDRFRLEIWAGGQGGPPGGWKEVPAILQPGAGSGQSQEHHPGKRPVMQGGMLGTWGQQYRLQNHAGRAPAPGLFVLYVLVGMVCVAFLMLPLHGEPSTLVPPAVRATVMQKLVCAYILGESQ
ncbi:MSPD1 protein, partial [Atractosteus spatula]|nr:MSPD1 protein [Atractosteus spatula]